MKKLLSLFLIITFVICLSSCSSNQYEQIELTKDNFSHYLTYNYEFTSCDCEFDGENYISTYTITIKTSKSKDCYFIGKSSGYATAQVSLVNGMLTIGRETHDIQIDYNGNSVASFVLQEKSANPRTPLSGVSQVTINFYKLNGYVLIPKK